MTQCCLKRPVQFDGIGIHSGLFRTTTLLPAPPGSGVKFRRTDVDVEKAVIPASWRNIVDSPHGTVLGNDHGIVVASVDLLLAALRICGVDNVLIEVSGEEIPAVAPDDLSLVSLINRAGVVSQPMPRLGIWIERPLDVRLGSQSALLNPSVKPTITAEIELTGTDIFDARYVSAPLLDHIFEREIFPAQGSGLGDQFSRPQAPDEAPYPTATADGIPQIDPSRQSSADAVPVQLFLRSLGCLALAEMSIFGHLFVNGASHRLIHALLREIFSQPKAWSRQSYETICQQCKYDQNEGGLRLH